MRRIVRQELLRRERTLEHDVGDVDGVPDPYDPAEVDAFVAMLRSPFPGSVAPRISRYLHAAAPQPTRPPVGVPPHHGRRGQPLPGLDARDRPARPGSAPRGDPGRDEIEAALDPPPTRPAAVQLVGYLAAELGMGELGRGMEATLRTAGEPVVTATETITASRQRHDGGPAAFDPAAPTGRARRRRRQRGLRQRGPTAGGHGPAALGVRPRPVHDRGLGLGGRGLSWISPRRGPVGRRDLDVQRARSAGDRGRCRRAGAQRPAAGGAPDGRPPGAGRPGPARRVHVPLLLRLLQRGRSQEPVRRHRCVPTGLRPRRGPAPRDQVDQRVGGAPRSRARAPARRRPRRRARRRRLRLGPRPGRARSRPATPMSRCIGPRASGTRWPRRCWRGGRSWRRATRATSSSWTSATASSSATTSCPSPWATTRTRRGHPGPTPTSTRPRRRCGGSSRIRPAPRPWASGPATTSSRFHSAEARVPLVAARLAAVRSARADDAVARAAALAAGAPWTRVARLGRAGGREAVRLGRRLARELG